MYTIFHFKADTLLEKHMINFASDFLKQKRIDFLPSFS